MKIEEAIVYALTSARRGLRTEQIVDIINQNGWYVRRDGGPVTSAQVYAVVMHFPEVFVKSGGRILLLM